MKSLMECYIESDPVIINEADGNSYISKNIAVDNIDGFYALPGFIFKDEDKFDNSGSICEILWNMNMENDDSGVKNIDLYITKISFNIKWKVVIDDLSISEIAKLLKFGGKEDSESEYIEGEYKFDTDELINGKEFKIEYEWDNVVRNISPKKVYLDFRDYTIMVEF